MSSINSNYETSIPELSLGKSDKIFNFFMFIILIIIFFIIVIPWNNLKINNNEQENMSGGTLTQLYSNDSQDVYLKSNVDKLATGNFDLFWNQPTRVANTFQNRGTPLPTIILPNTSMNPTNTPEVITNNYTDYALNKTKLNNSENQNANKIKSKSQELVNQSISENNNLKISNPKELVKVASLILPNKKSIKDIPALTEWTPRDELYQATYNNLLNNKNCVKDPASCGGGSGGYRLGEDFVQSTKAKPFVSLDGNLFYPDSYVGSYFIEPNFDIVKPYPIMPDSNLPPSLIKMG